MADIITAIKNDPEFCVAVLVAFLTFIGIPLHSRFENVKGHQIGC